MTMRTHDTSLPAGWEYRRLRAVMLKCLADSAAKGRAVPPHEVDDVMQEFLTWFLEHKLPDFDATRGGFATFVYSEFSWFVLRWRIDYHKWRAKRCEYDWLAQAADSPTPHEIVEFRELYARVSDAMHRLPDPAGSVFRRFVARGNPSERELAKELGITRHRVRLYLRDATGQLLVLCGKTPRLSNRQWNVVEKLWGEGLSVAQASQALALPETELEQTAENVITLFGRAIRGAPPPRKPTEDRSMLELNNGQHQRRLLKRALLNGDEQLLAEYLSDNPNLDLVQRDLSELDFSAPELAQLEANPTAVESLYNKLAQAEGEMMSEEELEVMDAETNSLAGLGRGLVEVLMHDLPSELQDWKKILSGVPKVAPEIEDTLHNEPDVRAAGEVGRQMVVHGVMPRHIRLGSDGVSSLVCNLLRNEVLKVAEGEPIRLLGMASRQRLDHQTVPFRAAALEIAHTADLDLRAAQGKYRKIDEVPLPASSALLSWFLGVVFHRPRFFRDFRAKKENGDVLLKRDEKIVDAVARWGITR